MAILAFIVLVVASIALTGACIGLGIPYWRSESKDDVKTTTVTTTTYTGLWNSCTREDVDTTSIIDCVSFTSFTTSDIRATQAMCILGTALCGAVVVMAFLKICVMKENKILCKVIAVTAILAGVFLLIGPIIYATGVKNDKGFNIYDLHAGFAMTIIAGILIILVGILAFFIK